MNLRIIVALLMSLAAAGAAADTPQERAQHVLDRLGYGARPGDVARVVAQGVDAYVAAQLDARERDPDGLDRALAALPTQALGYAALFREYGPPVGAAGRDSDAADRKALLRRQRQVADEAQQARLVRALESPRQLEEVMTEFWFDHFNVFAQKGLVRIWVGAYEREAIRPHALGRFRDLLGATAHSPAMLFYLDNWQSSAPGTGRRGRELGLNENYARELLELHTLGVDGGYAQKDVTELARILTGWSFDRRALANGQGDGFHFNAARHDRGEKTLLGTTFRDDGVNEGERALDLLAKHPSTARRVAFLLAQQFVADAPPAALVDRLAQKFRSSDGDIRKVLRVLFESPEFWDRANRGTQYKTPYAYVVSALRAADVHPTNLRPLQRTLAALGMPIYGCLTPDGYKHTEAAWLTPASLMDRIGFAAALGAGRLPLASAPEPLPDEEAPTPAVRPAADGAVDAERLAATLAPKLGERTRSAVAAAPPALRAGLLLGSPEFMRR